MAKPKERQISEAERIARSRGLKGNEELASAFRVNDDYVREIVKVESLPTPPDADIIVQESRSRTPLKETISAEQAVDIILREEMAELSTRLGKFGVRFDTSAQQDLVDHAYAILGGLVGTGGAIARR